MNKKVEMQMIKEFEKTKERIGKKILNYEKKYIRSEDGIIAYEILFEIDKELDRLQGNLFRKLNYSAV